MYVISVAFSCQLEIETTIKHSVFTSTIEKSLKVK